MRATFKKLNDISELQTEKLCIISRA